MAEYSIPMRKKRVYSSKNINDAIDVIKSMRKEGLNPSLTCYAEECVVNLNGGDFQNEGERASFTIISIVLYSLIFGFGTAISLNFITIINVMVGNEEGVISFTTFIPTIIYFTFIVIFVLIIIKTRLRYVSLGRRIVA